jgi:hypothetical protein
MKAHTDIEQSKKLAEILPTESADMWYEDSGLMIPRLGHIPKDHTDTEVPCWSLAALLSVISIATLECTKGLYHCVSYDGKDFIFSKTTDNPIDTCVETILKLHELKML